MSSSVFFQRCSFRCLALLELFHRKGERREVRLGGHFRPQSKGHFRLQGHFRPSGVTFAPTERVTCAPSILAIRKQDMRWVTNDIRRQVWEGWEDGLGQKQTKPEHTPDTYNYELQGKAGRMGWDNNKPNKSTRPTLTTMSYKGRMGGWAGTITNQTRAHARHLQL